MEPTPDQPQHDNPTDQNARGAAERAERGRARESAADRAEPREDAAERRERAAPRIYVASLSDYNDGRLHGAWIEASADVEELEAGVLSMLAASPTPGAEEWAIHDYENFGPLQLNEYESLSTIASLSAGIDEHGPAFVHWAALVGTADAETLERFEDTYLGHADSIEAYAEELLDDLGVFRQLDDVFPEQLQAYVRFDVEGFARDLELSGDVITSEADDGIYVFSGAM
jgi:antirestriction protein